MFELRSFPIAIACSLLLACAGGAAETRTSSTQPGRRDSSQGASLVRSVDAGDEEAFTRQILLFVEERLPTAEVEYGGPRTILLETADRADLQLSLDRAWNFCLEVPDECDAFVQDFLDGIVAYLNEAPTVDQLDPARLRVALRVRSAIPSGPFLVREAIGELAAIVMYDTPRTAMYLTREQADSLGLTEDEAFERALAQTLDELGPADAPRLDACESIGVLGNGGYYESTRLLAPDSFRALARTSTNPLLVTVPSYDAVLFTFGCHPLSAVTLRSISAEGMRATSTPLSAQVFRLTPEGFVVDGP